jgi:hypothetical protein
VVVVGGADKTVWTVQGYGLGPLSRSTVPVNVLRCGPREAVCKVDVSGILRLLPLRHNNITKRNKIDESLISDVFLSQNLNHLAQTVQK